MIRKIAFILFLLLTQIAFSQKATITPKKSHSKKQKTATYDEKIYINCVKKYKTSFQDRINLYPFNQTAKVEFVSFKIRIEEKDDMIIGFDDTLHQRKKIEIGELPMLNDTICYALLYEIKTLTLPQIEKLTDIIYNYGFAGNNQEVVQGACYEPRNAIILIDSLGKPIEFIEICFECRNTRSSSNRFSLGDMCAEKLGMIKKLFNSVGLKYGITEK